jgi:hypothetical protein
MNITQQELFKAFEALPTEAQQQVINLIAFLQKIYQTQSRNLPAATTLQTPKLSLNDLISSIPHDFAYPDDVADFTASKPLGDEFL